MPVALEKDRPKKIGRRNDPAGIRARLLDAAEALLAQRGFHGVTMREIAVEAEIKLGTLTYHFSSKDDLFRSVVLRRAPEYVRLTENALNAALDAAGNAPPKSESIVRAYVEPAFHLSMHGGVGWKNYMQMLGSAMGNRQKDSFISPILEQFDPLLKRIVAAFARVRPEADAEMLHWGLFFIEAAFIHILVEAGVVDRHSDGLCRSDDLERILEKVVPFFAAGFDRLTTSGAGCLPATRPAPGTTVTSAAQNGRKWPKDA